MVDAIDMYLANFDATENYDATSSLLTSEEHFEAVQIENYLTQGKRVAPNQARAMATRMVRNPQAKALVKEEMRKAGIGSAFNPAMPAFMGNLQAQVNFQIKRPTANINLDLPVPIFGSYEAASGYNRILTLPAGVSITDISFGGIGKENVVEIEYTQALTGAVDTIVLSLQEYAYPSFLEALKGSKFAISNGRYSISDTSNVGQQQMVKPLQAIVNSMFGKTIKDNIPLSASKSPFQQQNGIVDIIGNFVVDAETTWVLGFQPLANQEVTIAAFITAVQKAS